MGGSVGVNSVPGSGSTFWLKLELPVPEEAAAPEEVHSVAEPEPAQEQRGRILVAEDNQINQRVVSRMLERLGWDVDIAPDGVKAHALASKNRYAMVLMDCLMPEADGYTATAMIREHERQHGLPRLPIVALTANALSGDRERCLQAGMDDYLSKPLQLHLLKEVLQRWASASEVTAEL
jgi:CheY-like chemotaxis protein